jgi:uncharacterized membrane protein
MEENINKELKEFKDLREKYRHSFFLMTFETIFIFGIPALLGYFIGIYLKNTYYISKYIQILILLPMFILSWLILIKRYKNLDLKLKNINLKIKDLENK